MHIAKLWAFFNSLTKIQMVVASFVKLHHLASVLNLWMYAARNSFSCCWISMKCEVYAWILAMQSLSCSKSFILSKDLSELIAFITNVWVNPLDLAWSILCNIMVNVPFIYMQVTSHLMLIIYWQNVQVLCYL